MKNSVCTVFLSDHACWPGGGGGGYDTSHMYRRFISRVRRLPPLAEIVSMVGSADDIIELQQAWRQSQPGEAVVASPPRALDELQNFIFDTQVGQCAEYRPNG